jgi:hypothetical protein
MTATTIRRAWNGTTAEGRSKDRFANALAARVGNEIDPPLGVSVELADGWLAVADHLYAAAGEPMTAADVDAAAEAADITDLWEYSQD